jgi:hypothetical protein
LFFYFFNVLENKKEKISKFYKNYQE